MQRKFISVFLLLVLVGVIYCSQSFAATEEPSIAQASDMPLGQSAEGQVSLLPEDVGDVDGDDLFGTEGGYFHPYISVNFDYTDNLYNVETDEVENLLTTISPGIWFALPRKKIIPITINPHNSSPGGLQLQLEDYEGTDRFQAYALGGLDWKIYSDDSNLDGVDGILEGLVRYNMRGGLALQLVDRFTHAEDKLEVGASMRDFVRKFNSNLFMATADLDVTEKLTFQVDYVNFYLGYEEEINQFLDRIDNGFNLYGFFNYSLQTAFFLEYRIVDVAYDESTEIDNTSQFFYGGIKWDTTEKLALVAKLGYQDKKFDSSGIGQEDFGGFVWDVQLTYRYSEKSRFDFDLYKTNEETDNYLASDKTVLGSTIKYTQKFTERLSASLDLNYENADYSDFVSLTDIDREDDTYSIRPGAQYLFREWLQFELAYKYETRDSTEDVFNYESNTVILNANIAL